MNSNDKKLFKLTHAQQRIWYREQIFPELYEELICTSINFKTGLQAEVLKAAIGALIENNPDIRIRVRKHHGACAQYYADEQEHGIGVVTFSGSNAESEAEKYCREQCCIKFKLYDSGLYYFTILKINHTIKLLIRIHHIIADAWTIALIMNKIMHYYRAIHAGGDYQANKDEMGRYYEYYLWEQDYLSSEKYIQNAEYWKNKFKTIPEEVSIEPHKTLNRQDYRAAREYFTLPAEFVSRLNQFCNDYQTTVYHVMMAAIYIYIHKVTAREDIVVSTYIHNRIRQSKETIGMFISTIPVRISISHDMNFLSVLKAMKKEFWMCMKNQQYPYDQLVDDIRKSWGDENANFLNDILVSYQNAKYPSEVDYPAWHFSNFMSNVITFHISDRGGNGLLNFEIDYRTSLFQKTDIIRIFYCIYNLIQAGIGAPEDKIKQLDLLGEAVRNELLFKFNDTAAVFPDQHMIHQRFEEQVKRTPHHIAVVYKEKTLTYTQLNSRANQLAWVLRAAGVKSDDIVALLIDRTEEMVIGLLAVLKAGGGYLPIDPAYPDSRISYMIEDSGAKMLLTKQALENTCFDTEKIFIDDPRHAAAAIENLPMQNRSKDLAYIIYTSGSTGKPKGVMIEHQAVLNFIKGMTDRIDFCEGKTMLALTTISFDISLLELLLPLTLGMRLVIADEAEQIEPMKLNQLILREGIDMLQTTPSRMRLLLANEQSITGLKGLKEILVGGEAVTADIIKSLRGLTNARLYNMYGPTETTVWSSVKEIEGPDNMTIGKPIANTSIYIVNKNLELLPPGVIGEICIAGAGLARGYYKRDELNREKFVKIPDDYRKDSESNERMYRTGDLGWWMPNGEIGFAGRVDSQVKLRGYRIELEELEKVFMEYEGVQKCAALVRTNKMGHQYLVMFYVAEQEIKNKKMALYLKEQLPAYMVPSDFIWLRELPMTPNGKLDRKALTESSALILNAEHDFEAPDTICEVQIADIWKEVLGKEVIDKNTSFFDLGGNSFFLIMMHSKLAQIYPERITVADIFANPSIAKLAAFIEGQSNQKPERKELAANIFPEKFFRDEAGEQELCSLHMKLDDSLQRALLAQCRLEGTEPGHFMLGIYLYLFAEISEKDCISMHAWMEKMEGAVPIFIDFKDIADLPALFRQVKTLLTAAENGAEYKPEDLRNILRHKKPYSILPVFLYNPNDSEKVPPVYDLKLYIKSGQGRTELFMDSNNDKISPEAMKILLEGYVEMLHAAVDSL